MCICIYIDIFNLMLKSLSVSLARHVLGFEYFPLEVTSGLPNCPRDAAIGGRSVPDIQVKELLQTRSTPTSWRIQNQSYVLEDRLQSPPLQLASCEHIAFEVNMYSCSLANAVQFLCTSCVRIRLQCREDSITGSSFVRS